MAQEKQHRETGYCQYSVITVPVTHVSQCAAQQAGVSR
jgi:hypothetical protein